MRVRKAGCQRAILASNRLQKAVIRRPRDAKSNKGGQKWSPKLAQVANRLFAYVSELCSRWNLLPFTVPSQNGIPVKNLDMRKKLYHYVLVLAIGTLTVIMVAVLVSHLQNNNAITNAETTLGVLRTMGVVAVVTLAATTEVKKDEIMAVLSVCPQLVATLSSSPALSSSDNNVPMWIPNVQAATLVLVEAAVSILCLTGLPALPLVFPHVPSSLVDILEKVGAVPQINFVPHFFWRALLCPLDVAIMVLLAVSVVWTAMMVEIGIQIARALAEDAT